MKIVCDCGTTALDTSARENPGQPLSVEKFEIGGAPIAGANAVLVSSIDLWIEIKTDHRVIIDCPRCRKVLLRIG